MKYISLTIRIGCVFQTYLLLHSTAGYSDDAAVGCGTSLSAVCPSDASWTRLQMNALRHSVVTFRRSRCYGAVRLSCHLGSRDTCPVPPAPDHL